MSKLLISIFLILTIISCNSNKGVKKIVHLRYDDLKAIRIVPITINQNGNPDQITTYLDYLIETSFKKLERFEYIDINNWAMMRDKPTEVVRINKIIKEISRVQILFQNNRMNSVITLASKLLRHINADFKYFEDLDEVYNLKAYLAAGEALDDGFPNEELFKKIAVMDPKFKFNESIFGPEIIKMFNSGIKESRYLRKGTITISSDPVSAKVYIDGKFVGVTPYEGKYKLGIHYVKVEADGLVPFGKMVKVLPQENPVNVVFDSYELNRYLNRLRRKLNISTKKSEVKFPKVIIDFLKVAPFDQLLFFKTRAVDSKIYVTLYVYDVPAFALYKQKDFIIDLDDKNFKNEFLNNLESILNY